LGSSDYFFVKIEIGCENTEKVAMNECENARMQECENGKMVEEWNDGKEPYAPYFPYMPYFPYPPQKNIFLNSMSIFEQRMYFCGHIIDGGFLHNL
jgi:hypothetical protein